MIERTNREELLSYVGTVLVYFSIGVLVSLILQGTDVMRANRGLAAVFLATMWAGVLVHLWESHLRYDRKRKDDQAFHEVEIK